jgi:hypothetical protein
VRDTSWTVPAAVAVFFLFSAPMATAADGKPPLTGHQLLQLCEGIEAEKPISGTPADTRCLGYFQGVVDALDTLKAQGKVTCPPPTLTVKEIIHFYQSESQLFPDALEVRASELITGMLVKFFPCPGDKGRGA